MTYDDEAIKDFKGSISEFPSDAMVELTTGLKKISHLQDGSIRKIGIIDRLTHCATCSFYDNETDSLVLDFWVTRETRKAFNNHFSGILDLFQSFQALIFSEPVFGQRCAEKRSVQIPKPLCE